MTKGRFIAIEGVEGVGKKILANALELELVEKRLDIIVTEEPSDGAIGRRLRKILAGKLPAPNTEFEFQHLFIEDRLEHIKRTICPFPNLGHWVISAGYWLSTLAYGMLDGNLEKYKKLHSEIIGKEMIYPDMTLLLDAPAGQEKLEEIRCNYFWLAARGKVGNIAVIDAGGSKEEVLSSAIAVLHEHFNF